jgi:hypothetical protein
MTGTEKKAVIGSFVRESEKAILVDCEIDTHCGRRGVQLWFPKSRVEREGNVILLAESQGWLLDAKARELENVKGGFLGFCTTLR